MNLRDHLISLLATVRDGRKASINYQGMIYDVMLRQEGTLDHVINLDEPNE